MERVWETKVSTTIVVMYVLVLCFVHRAAILLVVNENEWNVFDLGNFELKMALE